MATPKKLDLQRRYYRPVLSANSSDMEEDARRIERNRRSCARLLAALHLHHPEHAPDGREKPSEPAPAVFVTGPGGRCQVPRNALAGI
jgi:hypothetical protein